MLLEVVRRSALGKRLSDQKHPTFPLRIGKPPAAMAGHQGWKPAPLPHIRVISAEYFSEVQRESLGMASRPILEEGSEQRIVEDQSIEVPSSFVLGQISGIVDHALIAFAKSSTVVIGRPRTSQTAWP
ncbi:MAG: hypothetical protein AAF317_14500, partial [Pseudomonadota bacterium]